MTRKRKALLLIIKSSFRLLWIAWRDFAVIAMTIIGLLWVFSKVFGINF